MKQSKWQILKAKLKGLEKQCWTMYKYNSDTMVAILQEKEISVQEFLWRITAYSLCFFRPLPKLERGERERNYLSFLRSPHSCHPLSPLSVPPTSMVTSLLPRVHVLPSHHCYSTGRQRSPLVILRPFLPLPNLFSLLHAAGVILLKYKCVHATSLT